MADAEFHVLISPLAKRQDHPQETASQPPDEARRIRSAVNAQQPTQSSQPGVPDNIPDREILSASLDLLLEITSRLRGSLVLIDLATVNGGTVRVFSANAALDHSLHRGPDLAQTARSADCAGR